MPPPQERAPVNDNGLGMRLVLTDDDPIIQSSQMWGVPVTDKINGNPARLITRSQEGAFIKDGDGQWHQLLGGEMGAYKEEIEAYYESEYIAHQGES